MEIFDQLKHKTRTLHEEAEQYNDASKVLDHSITTEEYQQLLITNYSSYKGLEDFLGMHKELLPVNLQKFCSYKNSNRIKEDLSFFKTVAANIERPFFNHSNPTVAYLIGVLYVMEGSMMGGMMISKNLLKCDNVIELPTQKFFNREVQNTLAYWTDFKEAVLQNEFSQEAIDEAIEGANDAFVFFKKVHLFYHLSEKIS